MLYQLYDRQIIDSLDDPLSKYLGLQYNTPEWRPINHWGAPSRFGVTLRSLANQLSGLPRDADYSYDLHQIIEWLNSSPGAIAPPFTEPLYSNLAYSMLDHVLTNMMNTTFTHYLEHNILRPLGLTNTGLGSTQFGTDAYPAQVMARMARSFNSSSGDRGYILPKSIGFAAAAGNMYSTTNDMLKLARWLLDDWDKPEVLDPQLRREMLRMSVMTADGVFLVGAPWEVQMIRDERAGASYQLVGKGGNIEGYSAYIGMVPALNLSISCAWTAQLDETGIANQLISMLVPQVVTQLASRFPTRLLVYEGSYQYTQHDSSLGPWGQHFNATISRTNSGLECAIALPRSLSPIPQLIGELEFVNSSFAYLLVSSATTTLLRAQPSCFVRMARSGNYLLQLKFKFSDDGVVRSVVASSVGFELPSNMSINLFKLK